MKPEINSEETAGAVAPATACYALDRRPWWKRRLCRFFGHHPMLPELPEWAKDGIVVNTRINFSMWDRLQILVTGNVSVQSWTACENLPGRVETWSHAMPKPPESLSLHNSELSQPGTQITSMPTPPEFPAPNPSFPSGSSHERPRESRQLVLAEITMKAADKLRAYWSKQEDCLEVWHPLGMQTCTDANWIIATLNADVIAELERRGYDKTTLRLSIEPKAGNPRFASQRLGENAKGDSQSPAKKL